jgi:NAD(P)H-dependent FMN reductase
MRKEFNVELIDLGEVNLPFLDEPEHPRFKKYSKQHTKDWSEKIQSADAYIIVTCEYNYGYPAALKNAFDFLYHEWNDKPVAFVSYGGIAGGTRSVQMFKQVVTALKMMPLAESVNIPFFTRYLDAEGKFNADENMKKGLEGMLNELTRWTEALKMMRSK